MLKCIIFTQNSHKMGVNTEKGYRKLMVLHVNVWWLIFLLIDQFLYRFSTYWPKTNEIWTLEVNKNMFFHHQAAPAYNVLPNFCMREMYGKFHPIAKLLNKNINASAYWPCQVNVSRTSLSWVLSHIWARFALFVVWPENLLWRVGMVTQKRLKRPRRTGKKHDLYTDSNRS